ncbi:DMT family transporter [Pseudobdellovibrio exovorus]|uniref:DMT family transporter n=1 Tax=Pseudobdellovibrio exovorus TaxID=453816 RepID=UPI00130DDD3C|nr:DMT family transporter [Pseudobdellovibrio exovorus]
MSPSPPTNLVARQQLLGFICVLLAGAGFGFLGIFGRLAFQSGLSVGELLSFRFILASLLMGIGLLLFKPQLLRISKNQFFVCAGLGILGYAVFSTFYFKAIEGISVPLAALLLFTFPVLVNLGAHFIFKERLSIRQWISLSIACVGLGILLWGPLIINSAIAVMFALAAALSYAVYVLVSGRYQKEISPITSSFYVIVFATIALCIFHRPDFGKISTFTAEQFLIISGIALISTIAPLALFLTGIQKLSSSKASIIAMIEPVVAAVAAALLLNEQLSGLQLVGAILVLLALVLNALK